MVICGRFGHNNQPFQYTSWFAEIERSDVGPFRVLISHFVHNSPDLLSTLATDIRFDGETSARSAPDLSEHSTLADGTATCSRKRHGWYADLQQGLITPSSLEKGTVGTQTYSRA